MRGFCEHQGYATISRESHQTAIRPENRIDHLFWSTQRPLARIELGDPRPISRAVHAPCPKMLGLPALGAMQMGPKPPTKAYLVGAWRRL